jgi:opacity protein-like surface antigen
MLTRSLAVLTVALAATLAPTAARAQVGVPPTADRFTVAGAFGGHSGAADLNPAGTADWRRGWSASIDGTYWVHRNLGIRATGTWAQDSLRGATLDGRGRFNKFFYDADLVLRYPLQAGAGHLVPYVLGGAGGASVHQLGSDSTWTKFAGNFGAGLEYRVGRLGFRAEGRDHVYRFDRYGFDKTQHDIAWQGGVTLSF